LTSTEGVIRNWGGSHLNQGGMIEKRIRKGQGKEKDKLKDKELMSPDLKRPVPTDQTGALVRRKKKLREASGAHPGGKG